MKIGKVVFVNPLLSYEGEDVRSDNRAYPYPGLMILASVLDKSGYDVKLIDSNLYTSSEFRNKLFSEINYDTVFIGFGLMTMNVAWAYPRICEIKERFPEMKIVVGGIHATLFPDQMIEDEHIDIVVINEACSTITILADTLKEGGDLSKIHGIYYKNDGEIIKNPPNKILDSFAEIPFINFSLIEHEIYAKNNCIVFRYFPREKEEYISYPIQTSFGCPYKCTFCVNAMLSRRYRYRSAEEIVERIEFLIHEYNANFIIMYDEEFCIDKKRLLRFIELVEEKKLKFQWRASLRVTNFKPDYIDTKLARRLEGIGFVSAVMGGESGNQRVLDNIKKKITVEHIVNAMKALSVTNITPKISFMVGMPGETDEEIEDTYRLCIKLKKLFLDKNKQADIGIFPFRLYPGSPLFDKAVEEKCLEKENRSLKEMASVSTEDMKEGMGYETIYKMYVSDPEKFENMVFLYSIFIWLNYGKTNIVRNLCEKVAMFRIENDFYKFLFIERSIIKTAKKVFKFMRKKRLS